MDDHPGGVIYRSGDDVWLEECISTPPSHILNGLIWALWGVRDYCVLTKEQYALDLYEGVLKTLEKNLYKYDVGFWTIYDLHDRFSIKNPRMPVSIYYQNLHVVQMEAMHNLTGREIFKVYHSKWESYLKNKLFRIV